MKVLLLGSGGREHALAWKLSQSLQVEKVYVAPGNADGVSCLGPSKAAAQLESSKQFAKCFMLRHNIPTPKSWTCGDLNMVRQVLEDNQDWPIVVKASGLTAGKGVFLATTRAEALQNAADILSIRERGDHEEHSSCLLLEAYHAGPEFSIVALTDGTDLLMFPPIKDYKRKGNGDKGPNTGGMGCVAPTTLCPDHMLNFVKSNILLPILRGMQIEGNCFAGVICVDLILSNEGPVVLDIDTRFGDAETQTLLPLLDEATDFVGALIACNNGNVGTIPWGVTGDCCVSVVATTKDYPEKRLEEIKISYAPCSETLLFLGPSKKHGDIDIAYGGRVLTVSAVSDCPAKAVDQVRRRLAKVAFPDMHFRTDIGFV